MKHTSGNFKGKGGLELFCQSWQPENETKASLVLVHGVGEHSNRYHNLIEHLIKNSIAIYAYDLRGHGRSQGRKGFINSWDDYRQDLHLFIQQLDLKGQRPFLMGHSLGGLIALDYACSYPQTVRGVIASSPALALSGNAGAFRLLAGLFNVFIPKFQLPIPLKATELSRDPTVVQNYLNDPLVHNRVTPRWIVEGVSTINRLFNNAGQINIPILLTHGDADKIVPIRGTQAFYDHLGSLDKTLIIYPQGRHEAHNDTNWKEATENISNWLTKRLENLPPCKE